MLGLLSTNKTLTKNVSLTFHPVDNLFWRPLCYRLHGLSNKVKDRRKIKQKADGADKKKSINFQLSPVMFFTQARRL